MKTINELQEEYGFIVALFANRLIKLNANIFIGDIDFTPSLFVGLQKGIDFTKTQTYKISSEEEHMLKELVKDSKQTAIELANKTNISVPTATKLMKKLKEENIILANKAIIDFSKLDYFRYSFLILANPKIEKIIVEYCRQHKNIWDIGKYAGSFNYILEIFADNNAEFEKIIQEIKNLFTKEILQNEILIFSKEHKHIYFPK